MGTSGGGNFRNGGGGGGGGGAPGNDFYQSSFLPAPPPSMTASQNGMNGSTTSSQQTHPQYYMPPPAASVDEDYDNEPPLHEELGINIPSVLAKAKAVANPFSKIDSSFADEADMTGPVVLGVLLGFAHMFQKKVQFSVIYSQMIVGCLSVYFIFNLMSTHGIDLYRSTSVLGYSLLPIVILSFLAPIKFYKPLAFLLAPIATACILWSSATATKIFVAVLSLQDQFWLVFYPLALVYTSFVIITIF